MYLDFYLECIIILQTKVQEGNSFNIMYVDHYFLPTMLLFSYSHSHHVKELIKPVVVFMSPSVLL